MKNLAVIYHSVNGNTRQIAGLVAEGAASVRDVQAPGPSCA
jgi:flavodoxin